MEEIDEFENKLQEFDLNQFRIKIIYYLLNGKEKSAIAISNNIGKFPILNFFKILNELKFLKKEGWIRSRIISYIKYYSVVDKKSFQDKLDKLISNSSEKLEKQKEYYYSLLDTVKKFEKLTKKDVKDPKSLPDFKIPEHAPEYIKNFLNKISKNHTLTPFKSEINIVVQLKREGLDFVLNSLEIEMKNQKNLFFGGIIFCSIESKEFSLELLEKLHIYNSNSLKFMYKLENKGYIENKTRELSDFSFSDHILYVDKNEFKTNFSLNSSNFSAEGVVESKIYSENPLIIGSLWAETDDFLKIIKKNISI
jgi:hypothetical protein